MKRILIILTAVLSISAQAQEVHDWENPAVLGINKLPYHATLQLPSKWKECKEIISLDGRWKFHWAKDPESRPTDFYREDFDVSGWDQITVPGNWQLQVTEIAYAVGFTTVKSFTMNFKAEYGMTPSEFRQKKWN